MEAAIIDALKREIYDQDTQQLLSNLLQDVRSSRSKMREYYPAWDAADDAFRNRRTPDKDDKKAEERGEPVKMAVPLTHSQIQTFVAFAFTLLTQRPVFFEIQPLSEESQDGAKVAEAVLESDLRHNKWEGILYQLLFDIARFGVGIVKSRWSVEYKDAYGPGPFGGEIKTRVVAYQGNRITNISPYQFFPDPRQPISKFQAGEFVASEEVWSRHELQNLESQGEIVGLEHVRSIRSDWMKERGETRVYGLTVSGTDRWNTDRGDTANVIVLEVQKTIIPSKVTIGETPLGEGEEPTKYVFWIANDNRLIKAEPLGYSHDEYTYDLGEFLPDVLAFTNDGLADTIAYLQSTLSWLINSRITNVRRIISERFIVDPSGVELVDLKERSPIIRLKSSAAKAGVDKYIRPLEMPDVTTSHLSDADVVHNIAKETTGINDTVLGNIATGRRSATENSNAFNSATARLRMIVTLIFRKCIEQLGRKMLSNLRDGLDAPRMVQVAGLTNATMGAPSFFRATRDSIQGDYDFGIYDGTLASEKAHLANALQEVFGLFVQNPNAAIALRLDPVKLLLEWLELRGVRNPRRFLLPGMPVQDPGAAAQGTAQGIGSTAGQSVLPSNSPGGFGGSGAGFEQLIG